MQKRQTVHRVRNAFEASERRACRGLGFVRNSFRYRRQIRKDEALILKRVYELVRSRPRFGYRRIARLLRNEGFRISNNRMHRLWRREGVKVAAMARVTKRPLFPGLFRQCLVQFSHALNWAGDGIT